MWFEISNEYTTVYPALVFQLYMPIRRTHLLAHLEWSEHLRESSRQPAANPIASYIDRGTNRKASRQCLNSWRQHVSIASIFRHYTHMLHFCWLPEHGLESPKPQKDRGKASFHKVTWQNQIFTERLQNLTNSTSPVKGNQSSTSPRAPSKNPSKHDHRLHELFRNRNSMLGGFLGFPSRNKIPRRLHKRPR